MTDEFVSELLTKLEVLQVESQQKDTQIVQLTQASAKNEELLEKLRAKVNDLKTDNEKLRKLL